MSRIIAGLAGSIKLKPAAKSTRPTSDRVKESLFAKLESLNAIEGAKVLDLYAGSGALGLEAASRGASEVIFVERDKAASEVIRENIRAVSKPLGASALLTLQNKEVSRLLASLAGTYNLVFVDPPYATDNSVIENDLRFLVELLEPDALVFVERPSRCEMFSFGDEFETAYDRSYGDTRAILLRRTIRPLT